MEAEMVVMGLGILMVSSMSFSLIFHKYFARKK
jgi:hypothetical protein